MHLQERQMGVTEPSLYCNIMSDDNDNDNNNDNNVNNVNNNDTKCDYIKNKLADALATLGVLCLFSPFIFFLIIFPIYLIYMAIQQYA